MSISANLTPPKRNIKRRLACAIFLLFLPLSLRAQSEPLKKFFAESFAEQLQDAPESATAVGHHEYDDRWNDWSAAGRALRRQHLEKRLATAKSFSQQNFSDQDHLSLRLYQYDLEQQLAADDLETHLLRVSQVFGLHNRVYLTIDRMPARTLEDYNRLLARLHSIPAYVDQNIAILDESIQRGIMQPRNVVDMVRGQLATQIAQDASASALLVAFRQIPNNFRDEDQSRLHDAAVASYTHDFLPAWKKLLAYLDGPYAAKARSTAGIGSIPSGREAYAILVRRYTTTNTSPEEIHKIGEAEVQRIEAAMTTVARDTGFRGTLPEFEAKMSATPEQHFQSRDDMLIYCRNAAKIIEPNLPNLFRQIPMMLYGIRAIPEDREAATPSNAQAPSPDGSTPGWFNLNAYEPTKQLKSNKESLVLHEAVPGHIFQGSLARSISGLPEFRRFYGNSAYSEGWALYVESLGKQLGLYTDPYSVYGALSSERFRAVRLVVDTGLHSLGWTREQAVEYFHAHVPDQSVAEIDRYIAWPGQALSYKMGQLKILELRHQAEQKLGTQFDIRDFHAAVLRDGGLPLDLLQEQVQKYIATGH